MDSIPWSMEKLRKILEKYPSSLKAKDALEKLTLEQKNNKINNSLTYLETCVDIEKPCTWNFISFLYFCTDEKEKAEEFNSKVLEHSTGNTNLIAIANKARFELDKRNLTKCRSLCDQLKNLKEDNSSHLIAKAEIAFTYSRLGTNFYHTASNLFKNVIKEYDNGVKVPSEYVCIWMYDYALTLKRRLHVGNLHDEEVDLSDDKHKHILEIFCRVIHMAGEEDCLKHVKARVYVDIGSIAYIIKHSANPREMKSLLPEDSDLDLEVQDYFEKASNICPQDVYVLERSAKYYRYMRDYEESERLLKKALEIRKTSFIYHHLGLNLLKELEQKNLVRQRSIGSNGSVPRNPPASAIGHSAFTKSKAKGIAKQKTDLDDINTKGQQTPGNINKTKHTKEVVTQMAGAGSKSTIKLANTNRENPRYNKFEPLSSSSTDHAVFSPSQDASKSVIKSPLRPRFISYEDNKDNVDKIIEYFDEAIKLSTNCAALYDKGLLYRQTKRYEKAFEVFENMTKNKDDSVSLIYLANAYEQAALCILDLLETEIHISKEAKTDMETKLKTYLVSSIEISSNWIAKFPSLNNSWNSLPTLGKVLNTESNNEEDLDHCAFYYSKIQDYTGAIQALDKLVKKADIFQDKAKTYLCQCDYDNAVMTFNCYLNHKPEWRDEIDTNLYLEVHIKAGLDAFGNGREDIAKLRIRNAFDFIESPIENVDPYDVKDCGQDDKEKYDLFILCDIDDETNGQHLMTLLNRLGLQTTSNADNINILPGTPEDEGITHLMEKSKNFVIINDTKEMKKETQYFARIIGKLANNRPQDIAVVVITRPGVDLAGVDVPSMIRYGPTATISMDMETLAKDDFKNDAHMLKIIEDLLMALLRPKI
ncbi:uncharacterized protein LOC123536851 [Mercenaria mercenaria]|uniref:uncharacterized protein LOC123536851 n=1 Tax=Mercenaria mercenaria TaxID=6596 RepID=UPI00234F1E20|nr:uncharacterized protein LOC123536851 [Mercenaria mercenaria]